MQFEMELHTLDLSGQNLKLLPNLANQQGILSVRAEHNAISAVGKLPPSLRSLSFAHNKLAFVGHLDTQAPHLECLDLSHNRLISLEGLCRLRALQHLDISFNYVGDDQICALRALKTLKSLNVAHNHLQNTQ